jgi:hypothetical protein
MYIHTHELPAFWCTYHQFEQTCWSCQLTHTRSFGCSVITNGSTRDRQSRYPPSGKVGKSKRHALLEELTVSSIYTFLLLLLHVSTGRSLFMQVLFVWFHFNATWILYHFSNLHDNVRFNAIWHGWYTIIFGLRRFGIDKMWPHLSSCWWLAAMTLLSHHQSHVWID